MEQVLASASDGQYPHLVERALACIEEHGGALDEDRLIARVFGGGSPSIWRPLLRSLLDGQAGLSLRPDGIWSSRETQPPFEFPAEFVVLDVETTGLKPSQQRIVEIGMIRVSSSGSPLRWSTLVNPGRPIPAYIADLTRIDDQLVADAPEFRSIAPTIVEIAGDLPIVSHNVDFDLAFINAELLRCGLPKLVNPGIDTLALANRLVDETRRLNLADVARALGIDGRQAHRALADADTTLAVFHVLVERARQNGFSAFDDLRQMPASARPSRTVHKPVGRGRSILDRSHLSDIPHAPGVYVMRDDGGRVLYIGKAKDLRKRVASYYSQPLGYTRKMDGLLETLAKIEVEVTGTELEALILESQLIRRYRPRFNTVQRNVEQYVYVKVDISNPWPRVVTSRDRANDGAVYFGPFRSASRAKEAVELVNDVLPLRSCRRSFQDKRSYGSPCIDLDLHRCLGPCVGRADAEQYRGLVRDVLAFFRGDTARLIAHLHAKLAETVRTLDFERASRLRDQIRRAEYLAGEQRQLDGAARYPHALLVLPNARKGARDIWYLLNGRRWAQLLVDDAESPAALQERLSAVHERAVAARPAFVHDHHTVDETAILWRWMRRTPEHPALIPLEGDVDLEHAARLALAVDLGVPFGEAADGDGEPEQPRDEDLIA